MIKKNKQKWVIPDLHELKLKNTKNKTEQIPPIIEGRKNPGAYTISS